MAAALVVAGVSVVFAGQALQPQGDGPPAAGAGASGRPSAQASVPATPVSGLPAPPQLEPFVEAVTTAETVDLAGRLAEDLPREAGYRLRIYVNGELVRDRRLPRRRAFTVAEVPLSEGRNEISAAVAGPTGEGLHATPVEIERDSSVPLITVDEPPAGPVYDAQTVVRGRGEAGSTLSATNLANGAGASFVIGAEGTFEVSLALAPGSNEIVLQARDRAGNEHRTSLLLERRDGAASVRLSISRETIALGSLPTTLTLRARVLDPAGQPIEGAEVTLSISPPGLPTLTHIATSGAGGVTWAGVRIAAGAQPGQGLVTVLAVLPTGETLQESQFFTIE